jgi:O-antigen ligase
MKTLNPLLMPDTLDNSPLMVRGFRLKANQIAYWCWCLMLFFIPFSTALGLLMSALAIVSGLLGFSLQSFKKTFKQPVIILCVLLFGWLTLSMLWSIAPKAEMLEAWSKYRKLLYPALVMMVLYNLRRGPSGLVYGFLAGCGVVAVMSLSSAYGILELLLGPPADWGVATGWYVGPGWLFVGGPENPTFGRNHITQSAFLAFASMLALGQAWYSAHEPRMRRCHLWIFIALIYLHPIFLLQARTGYLLAVSLFAYWIFIVVRHLHPGNRMMVVLGGASIFMAMIAASPHITERTKILANSLQTYAAGSELTDSGVRLDFWKSGLKIISDSPIAGDGLGSFAEAYSKLEDRPEWLVRSRPQPHSEIVLIATQGGLIALVIFMTFLIFSLWHGFTVAKENPGLLGILALFYLDSGINSVIWDLAEGHFYTLITVLVVWSFPERVVWVAHQIKSSRP